MSAPRIPYEILVLLAGDGWRFNASFRGLNAVWGSGRCDVWAVGNGMILHHS